MNCCNNGFCVPTRTLKFSQSFLFAAIVLFMASAVAFGAGDATLAPLENVSMGISSTAVIDKIKPVGTHSSEPSPWDKRKKVIWQLPDNSNYDKVMFLFTEKDRLYLMRFVVKKAAWSELHKVKTALLERYGISSEKPGRLRIQNQDVLVYEGLKSDYSFFEFTDTKTGEKAFELYDRKVSTEDQPKKGAKSKSESRQ